MVSDGTSAYFGARFSLYPMTDRFVPVILQALEGMPESGLEVETDDVSTFLEGHPDVVFGALERVYARAAGSHAHVVMTLLLSRGCPGETVCEPAPGAVACEVAETATPPTPGAPEAEAGLRVACQWSLYPLGVPGYMEVIYREIKRSKESGVFTRGQHFVSRLDGELHTVLTAIRRAFDAASTDAGHVVAHATLSTNSPSAVGKPEQWAADGQDGGPGR